MTMTAASAKYDKGLFEQPDFDGSYGGKPCQCEAGAGHGFRRRPCNILPPGRWFRLLTEQLNTDTQSLCLQIYTDRLDVPHDDAEFVRWHRLIAEQAAMRQSDVGRLYDNMGKALLPEVAVTQLQSNFARRYANGRGMPRDDAEAVRRFRMAAAQGNVRAQFNLGASYADGRGVPQYDAAGYLWLNLAESRAPADEREQSAAARDEVAASLTPVIRRQA